MVIIMVVFLNELVYSSKSHSTFDFIFEKIRVKEIEGKKTDWSAWVALLYLHEMKDLFKRSL